MQLGIFTNQTLAEMSKSNEINMTTNLKTISKKVFEFCWIIGFWIEI